MDNTQKNNLGVPVAIVVAGVLVAGAVLLSGNDSEKVIVQERSVEPVAQAPAPQPTASLDAVAPVTSADHIKGNPNASVKIVEYSDFECPFCKRFHVTMNQIMDEFGGGGEVAWVYRQFPLDSLHPVKARQEALATECAAEQGGNDTFWAYTDRLFELSLTNNRTDIETVIPQIVNELGLDRDAFQECMESDRYNAHIDSDIANAAQTGGRGTPWSILIASDGTKYPINGAQSYESVKQLIELALKK